MKITTAKKARTDTWIIVKSPSQAPAIKDFEGAAGETTVRYEKKNTLIYCGTGDCESAAAIRNAAANGVRKAQSLRRSAVSLFLPDASVDGAAEAAAEGAALAAYTFDKFKSMRSKTVSHIECIGAGMPASRLRRITSIARGVFYARDLINDNAHTVTPGYLASQARALVRGESDMSCTVLSEKEIRRHGLGLLEAVGQGSPYPPRLILISYTGNSRAKQTTALVGKGITFDSGGQNLKPSGSIESMREDMAGAAAVMGVMHALRALKPKINVTGVIAAAHNAIDGNAYFPGDVYRSYAGKSVEITNTDAEGRLALADAIAFAEKKYAPAAIIDFATLTGGILVALGPVLAGLFANDELLARRLFDAGERTGERLWQFPLYSEYFEFMKSDIADIRNTAKLKRGHASSITGAAFIGSFVEKTPWAHIDIAGTAFNESEARGIVPKLGAGFGVRLALDYLLQK
jgi:leucyl aminopeptidase